MQRIRPTIGAIGIWMFCSSCFPGRAVGHTLWINASDYTPQFYPRFGARTKVYFGYGHRYPVDDFLPEARLDEFFWICPECGKHHQLTPNSGGFGATAISFRKEGSYIVCATLKAGFYTMYLEGGSIHHKLGPKTGIAKTNIILSLYYEQYAKALINVGTPEGDAFKKPAGQKLEIIPLENPINLREGDVLPVQVLFEGKPAKFWSLYATYSGFSTRDDFAFATTTDSKGTARIRLLHHGPWLLKATNKVPATDELKDKCNQLHYTATLTFEVP